jgi:hypothetical protein
VQLALQVQQEQQVLLEKLVRLDQQEQQVQQVQQVLLEKLV